MRGSSLRAPQPPLATSVFLLVCVTLLAKTTPVLLGTSPNVSGACLLCRRSSVSGLPHFRRFCLSPHMQPMCSANGLPIICPWAPNSAHGHNIRPLSSPWTAHGLLMGTTVPMGSLWAQRCPCAAHGKCPRAMRKVMGKVMGKAMCNPWWAFCWQLMGCPWFVRSQ